VIAYSAMLGAKEMSLIQTLLRLQQVDTEWDDKRGRFQTIRKRLSDSSELEANRAAQSGRQKQLSGIRGQLRDHELRLQSLQQKLKQIETDLYGGRVTAPRELEALQQELGYTKQHISETEDAVLMAMTETEDLEAACETGQLSLANFEARWDKERVALSDEYRELHAQLLVLKESRDKLRSTIGRSTLALYDELRASKGGMALAPAKNGLTERDLFVGRHRLLQSIRQELGEGKRLFLLFGKEGIGKTSLINQLVEQLRQGYQVTRLTCPHQSADGQVDPIEQVLQQIARHFGQPMPEKSELTESDGLAQFLSRLFSGSDRAIHLLCFDDLPLDSLRESPRWQQLINALCEAKECASNLALLFSVSGLPEADDPLTCHAEVRTMILGPLAADDSEVLISTPVRGRLSYDHDSLRRIHLLAGGEPRFVQLLAHIVYEQRASAGWVGFQQVDQAMRNVVDRYSTIFERMWQSRKPAEQLVLCAFAEMIGRHGISSAAEVAHHLSTLRIQIPQDDLTRTLAELERLQIIDRLGSDALCQRNHLFRQWVKENHNSISVLDESHAFRLEWRRRPSTLFSPTTDWGGILLWILAGMLALGILYIWRSRDKEIVWTAEPTTAPTQSHAMAPATPRILPTPERGVAPGNIVYIAKEELSWKWDIYAMRSDGSDPVRLTDHDSNDTSPVWSPDGRTIAFVSDRDGNREIYVMNADGNDQVNISLNGAEDWTPSWSPDGNHIAFASFRDGNWEVYIMGADGSDPQRLTNDPAADYGPSWSPDGQRIAFSSQRDGNLEIYTMNPDGSDQQRFTDHPATDRSPLWSPDGKQLLWETYRDGNMEIYAINIDGSDPHNLSQDAYADDHGPTWSPWGDRIAYYSNHANEQEGGWDIYTLNIETGEQTNLTQSPMLEQSPHWGP